MFGSSKRVRCYYAFLIVYIILQLIFLSVLKYYNQDTHSNAIKILEIYKELSVRLNGLAEVDNSGIYKIVELKKSAHLKDFDITLVSQCSSNHFSAVYKLFMSWEGPISVALFSEVENIEKTLWDAAKFIHCFNFRNFALQLIAPTQEKFVKNFKFGYNMLAETDKSVSCNSPLATSLNTVRNYNWTGPYPVNLLRNTARLGSSTDYSLVIDIDMIPSFNLRTDFLNFIKSKESDSEKVVYVVPVFEILPNLSVPSDKSDLLRYIDLNQARPFYLVPCRNCQKLTNYYKWVSHKKSSGVRELYEVRWKHPWEPFFIAPRQAPSFDERFRQYGMNRVSQICELHVAGYKFLVLDNVFLVHEGFKTGEDFHETKRKEMEENRKLYARFKVEVKYKYPYSERSC